MVDVLWSYDTVESAAAARRTFGARQVRWLECPLIPEDLEAHRELAAGDGTPIALGEHFFTHHQSLPWFRARALSVFQPDMGRTGFSDALRQTALAREHGIAVSPHMGSGSPIVQAAALHFWAAIRPALPCEYQHDLAGVLAGNVESAWRFAGGGFAVPDRPGLGVTVDETGLEARSQVVERWRAR
jgi:galactonate dehydratase